jgi:MOSC domain-containing protein YiiM
VIVRSVNVGLPRSVQGPHGLVVTGIYKTPVAGRVRVRKLNVDGDGQADPRVHGGVDKAVYVYAADHYSYWRSELGRDLAWGEFGENLDVDDGCREDDIAIGDTLRAGTVLLQVTGPRLPCAKLGLRFGDAGMIRRFLSSGRTGFYARVLEEGDVAAGDAVVIESRDVAAVPVSEVTRLYTRDRDDVAAIRRLLGATGLDPSWRQHFEQRLAGGA